MLLAGLTTTAMKSKKTARTLAADTKLEMEIISQCGSGGLEDYRPSRTNMAKLKLEGQIDVVEYSNKELKVSLELIKAVRAQKDYATLGKLKSFEYVSGIPGKAYNLFVNEEAMEAISTMNKS